MISIIGAGPVGNYLAWQLAKKGKEVQVFEEHKSIGLPVQCTGIITPELHKAMEVKSSFTQNEIKNAIIYAPNGKSIFVKFKDPDIIVNRNQFDQYLADEAQKAGAKYYLEHRYKGNEGKTIHINDKKIKTDYLIGADGPLSRVAKNNNMWCNRKTIIGNQVTAEVECEDPATMEIWLGIGLFSWSVPEGNGISRVGCMSYDKPTEHLQKLLELKCPGSKVLGKQPGKIPIFNRKQKIQNGFVYLIGDAATQVKPTSYGGIIHGMKAARILVKDMENYEKICKKEVNKDLYLSHIMRKAMDKFSHKDWNDLVKMFSQERIKRVLETNSRDFPTKFVTQLLLKEPRLLKYGLRAIV
jgi:digeranylgeranylglycerophospholipid reductase